MHATYSDMPCRHCRVSIFNDSTFLFFFAWQFSLHMVCMIYAVARSKDHLAEDYEPDLDGDFHPNMINSVVFLVGAVQQVRS